MKKYLSLLAILLIATTSAVAQNGFSLIVSGGYQGSNVFSETKSSQIHGYRLGAVLDLPLVDFGLAYLSVQSGVNYSIKGTKYEIGILTLENKYSYFDVPILAVAHLHLFGNTSVFVNAGPYLAYATSNTKDTSMANEVKEFTAKLKNSKERNHFDWGLQIGTGLDVQRFILSVGYQMGVQKHTALTRESLKIMGEKILGELEGELKGGKARNSSFFVTVGYRF